MIAALSPAQAAERARWYGRQTLTELDRAAEPISVGTAPCQGRGGEIADDGRYYLHAVYQVPLAPGQHVSTVERMRDAWAARGFEVTDFRIFARDADGDADGDGDGDEATVTVRNPADGFQLVLTSTRPATMLALQVFTPCLRPPTVDGQPAD